MIRANSSVHAWTTIKDKKLCNLQTGKQMNDIYVNRALPCSMGVIDLELLCLYWTENNDVKLFFKIVATGSTLPTNSSDYVFPSIYLGPLEIFLKIFFTLFIPCQRSYSCHGYGCSQICSYCPNHHIFFVFKFSRVFEKHDHLAFVNRAQLIILWDLSPIATTLVSCAFLPASPKAKAGLGVQSHRPSVRPSVPKTWIPITLGCFVPSLVEIGPVVLEKRSKIGKVYRRTDGRTYRQTTDDRGSEKLTCAFSSGELFKIMNNMLIARRI